MSPGRKTKNPKKNIKNKKKSKPWESDGGGANLVSARAR
jgi:hypothetical protein